MSVLPKNRQVHTKLHPGYEWDIFHILTSEDIADVIPLFFLCFLSILFNFRNTHYYVIKRIIFSLEGKLHIFTPPCNILYISSSFHTRTQARRRGYSWIHTVPLSTQGILFCQAKSFTSLKERALISRFCSVKRMRVFDSPWTGH